MNAAAALLTTWAYHLGFNKIKQFLSQPFHSGKVFKQRVTSCWQQPKILSLLTYEICFTETKAMSKVKPYSTSGTGSRTISLNWTGHM